MAYATQTGIAAPLGLVDRAAALLIDIRARRARAKIYRTTVRELSGLSMRELEDLGISRTDIQSVAYSAAYKL